MFGLFHLPWWGYFLVLMAYTQLSVFAVTLFLHRSQAHRALTLHPIITHIFRFWLWMSTGIVTKEWVAIHRKHHAKVETPDDPHSPQIQGIKKVLLEGAEIYQAEAKIAETLNRYGDGTPQDWLERYVYTGQRNVGIILMFAVNVFCFGIPGVAIWALQMAWMPFFAAGVINGIGHYFGYRNYEPKDASRNIVPIAFFLGGEELHNNHHAFATSAKFSAKWWEFDIGWAMIRLLQCVGLAKPRRVLTHLKIQPGKNSIDQETLKAVITHRFQLMSRYGRDVVLPALREERNRAGKHSRLLLARARMLLVRDASIMEINQKTRLASVLENFQSLQVVYQFRLKLQSIWERSTLNQKELIDALQEWCLQAEATGIEALRRFATQLKSFVPHSV